MPPKRAAAAAAPSRAKQPRVQPADAPAPPPLGAAKPAPPAPQAAKESGHESPTNPAPKASSGPDSGDVPGDFDGVREISAAEAEEEQSVRARCDQTDDRLCMLLKTAEDKNYYRIRYLGASVPGSYGKKKAAMEAIRDALEHSDLFPTVSPSAPTTHAHLATLNHVARLPAHRCRVARSSTSG